MKQSSKVQALSDMIAPAVTACGLKLWGIEFSPQGKRSLLRIYIDVNRDGQVEAIKPSQSGALDNKESGVSVDDCMRVSHQVSGVLEVHDPIHGEYVLEVSSPGWDRRFFNPEQMLGFIGQSVSLRLIHALDGRRKYTGSLISVDEKQVVIQSKDNEQEEATAILVSNIDKATLVFTD